MFDTNTVLLIHLGERSFSSSRKCALPVGKVAGLHSNSLVDELTGREPKIGLFDYSELRLTIYAVQDDA